MQITSGRCLHEFCYTLDEAGQHPKPPAAAGPNATVLCQPACDGEAGTGGVAVGDIDGDGRDDIVMTRIDNTPKIFAARTNGTTTVFEDVTDSSGLTRAGADERADGQHEAANTNGVALADVDNDGDLDMVFTTVGLTHGALLFINNGIGKFDEQGAARGCSLPQTRPGGASSGTSVTAGDYDRDGWVDLFLAEWLDAYTNVEWSTKSEGFKILHNRGGEGSVCGPHANTSCAGVYEETASSKAITGWLADTRKRGKRGTYTLGLPS